MNMSMRIFTSMTLTLNAMTISTVASTVNISISTKLPFRIQRGSQTNNGCPNRSFLPPAHSESAET